MEARDFLEANYHIQISNNLLETIPDSYHGALVYAADKQMRFAGCLLGSCIEEYFEKGKDHNTCAEKLEKSRTHTYQARILASKAALINLLDKLEYYLDRYTSEQLEKSGIELSEHFDLKNKANELLEILSPPNEDLNKNVDKALADDFSKCYSDLATCINNLTDKHDQLDKYKKDEEENKLSDNVKNEIIKRLIQGGLVISGIIVENVFDFF